MKRYDTKIPHRALGVVAVTMTALTLGLTIVVPALAGTAGDEHLMAANVVRTEVAISPAHIEIVAVR